MTVAICLNCGEFKHGAFNPCPHCGYTPEDEESLTKHLIVTDHYYDQAELKAISEQVKSGELPEFDPETLQTMWVSTEGWDKERLRFQCCQWGCVAIITAIIVGLMVWSQRG